MMKLLFRERAFSWLDSYDVFREDGTVAYRIEGKLAFKHRLEIRSPEGNVLLEVKENFTWLQPEFTIAQAGKVRGKIIKEFTLFRPKFQIKFRSWQITGNFLEWDYRIQSPEGCVAAIRKKIWNFTDTYELEITDPADALDVQALVVAIDVAKCSRK